MKKRDLGEMERYAKVIDIEDIHLFTEKCKEITTMSIEQFTKIADFLFILSNYISTSAFTLRSQQGLIDELREKQEKQEKKITQTRRSLRMSSRFISCFCCGCCRWIVKKCLRSITCLMLILMCLATIFLSCFFLGAFAIKIGLSYAIDPIITHWASLSLPVPIIPLFVLFPTIVCLFHVVCLRPVMSLINRRLEDVAHLDLEPKNLSCCDRYRMKCVFCYYTSLGQMFLSTNRLRDQMNVFVTLVPSYILDINENSDSSVGSHVSSKSGSSKSDESSGSWEESVESTFFLSRLLKRNALEMIPRSNVFLMKLVIWNFREIMSSHFHDGNEVEFVKSFEKLAQFVEESATRFKGTVERWNNDGSILISWNTHRLITSVSKESGIKKTADTVMKLASYIIRFMDMNLKNLFSVGLFGSFGTAWIGSLGSARNRNFHIQGPITEKIRMMQRLVARSQKNNNKSRGGYRPVYDQNSFFFDEEIGMNQRIYAIRPVYYFFQNLTNEDDVTDDDSSGSSIGSCCEEEECFMMSSANKNNNKSEDGGSPCMRIVSSQHREFLVVTTQFKELPESRKRNFSKGKEWMYERKDEEILCIERDEMFALFGYVEDREFGEAIVACHKFLERLGTRDDLMSRFLEFLENAGKKSVEDVNDEDNVDEKSYENIDVLDIEQE